MIEPRSPSAITRRILLALIAIAAAWTLLVSLTGGVDLRPFQIPFKSTEPDRPLYATLLIAAVYAAAFRRRLRDDAVWIEERAAPVASFLERRAEVIVVVAAVAVVSAALLYGIHVAGGSDSYGYVSQSRLWLSRDLVVEQPIATQVPWPDADWTFTPLGYRPAQKPGAIVPVYAPGLPVLMALATLAVGVCGPYLVVPLMAGVLVWLTYRLGGQVWSRAVGLTAAMLMATSPTFLFMAMNPMSDVPVSVFFVAAMVIALSASRRRAFWTGLVLSIGIFIRPNLVPVGALYLWVLLTRAPVGERWRTSVWFGLGGLPLVLAIAATNAVLYGAPWRAGYGGLDELYSWRYFFTNVGLYTRWLIETETPLVFLFAVPVLWIARRGGRRTPLPLSPPCIDPAGTGDWRLALRFMVLTMAAVWLSYLVYAPFDVWWYLRFMLPAFPAMFVLVAIGGAAVLARAGAARRVAAAGVILAVPIFAFRVTEIRARAIFDAPIGGVVYVSAAEYVRTRLPENAVILTIQHSGSIRHYANRLTMRWDLLNPDWWPRALDVLVERGYRPYLLVSSFEERQLRMQFGFSDAPDAPGAVVAEMNAPEQIRIYDPLRQNTRPPGTIPAAECCPCTLHSPAVTAGIYALQRFFPCGSTDRTTN